ncbi:MAG: transporter substrate-binding domain-containing protein [Alphaproteobacteria bacterium]|nr:transporter substrate-binding domain-containing protein [Rhodospirillales bacterium]MCW9045812.1 transporter substrate-binding domain-containing protein [Alphaproteobacteria bacterium]
MKRNILAAFILFLSVTFPAFAEPLSFALVGVEDGTHGFQITQSLADEIGSRSGQEITIIALPAHRAKQLFKSGRIDGDWSRVDGFGKDIYGIIKISEPIASHPYFAYATRDDIKINGWESLKPYRVAYPRGWAVIELNLEPIHKNLIPVASAEAGLKFVAAGRADVFINIPFIVNSWLATEELKNKGIKAVKPPLDFLHVYIHAGPQHAELTKKMEASLKAMKLDGTYDKIMSGAK